MARLILSFVRASRQRCSRAAWTAVDAAEDNGGNVQKANAEGTENIAKYVRHLISR